MREEGVDATKSPVDTLYWMREAELKHGRVAQLAGKDLTVGVCVVHIRHSRPFFLPVGAQHQHQDSFSEHFNRVEPRSRMFLAECGRQFAALGAWVCT